MSNRGKIKSTLCWKCSNSTNSGCSWSRELKPVDGWTAEEDHLVTNYKDNKTYLVIDCPEFIEDQVRKCENCRFFKQKKESSAYGYCEKNYIATDIYRYCLDWKKGKR